MLKVVELQTILLQTLKQGITVPTLHSLTKLVMNVEVMMSQMRILIQVVKSSG